MKRRLLPLLLFFSILFSSLPTGICAEDDEYFPLDFHALACESQDFSPLTRTLPETGTFDPNHPGYGAQLEDEIALTAYAAIETQLMPNTDRIYIDLSSFSISDWSIEVYPPMLAAVAAYVFDHPESQYCTFSGYGKSGTQAVYVITHPENAQDRKDALDSTLSSFTASFDTSRSVLEQYKFIHDYICELASYNTSAAVSGVETEAHTAYGLLVDRDAVVCEGYSKSFKLLCDAVGLPCILIAGEAAWDTDGDSVADFTGISNHMWNAVCLDQNWYFVDTTWDDVDGYTIDTCPGLELSMVCYDYFLNNDPFLGTSASQNHRATGYIHYTNNWPMVFGLPEGPEGRYADVATDKLSISVTSKDLSIPASLWDNTVNNVPLNTISEVTILLAQDTSLSATLPVPSAMTYTLDSFGGSHSISRTDGFDGALFDLTGTLTLANVILDGTSEVSKVLATLNGGTLVDLKDPDLTGYLSYTGLEDGVAIGYQASYDTFGQMLSIGELGNFQLTVPGLYAASVVTIPDNATFIKQFLLSPDSFAPLTACLLPTS